MSTAGLVAECVLPAGARLGEGPIWDDRAQRLYWVDILSRAVHRFDPASGIDETAEVGQHVGTVVPRQRGGLMLAVREGLAEYEFGGPLRMVARPPTPEHPACNRFNDGKCDPAGRFWAGTMHESVAVKRGGNLYCLERDFTLRRVVDGVTVSNGLAWSLDGRTMYYIDSPTFEVAAFDYDVATGAIGGRRVAVQVGQDMGIPDGMTIDTEGMLWVAHWGGGCVRRWNPADGTVLAEIRVAVSQVSACAFGGAGLDQLYITTAAEDLTAEQRAAEPLAGGLFVCSNPGTRGVPAFAFAG
jgi:sugar lactone lactonase YvrE